MSILGIIYLLIAGAAASLGFYGLFIFTGRSAWLYGVGGAVLAVAGIWLVFWMIETDLERVEKVIHTMEQAARENDHATLLEHISRQRPRVREFLEEVLPRVHFKYAKVTAIHEITIDRKATPKRAVADINLRLEGGEAGRSGSFLYLSRMDVTFIEEEGQWRVLDYREKQLIQKKKEQR